MREKKIDQYRILNDIKNTQDRLDLIYPNAHQLNISDNGRYFTVTLKLSLNND